MIAGHLAEGSRVVGTVRTGLIAPEILLREGALIRRSDVGVLV
jgi:hypothetical protein